MRTILRHLLKRCIPWLLRFRKFFGRPWPETYFIGPDKVYLASADQFKTMEPIVEGDGVLQCRHFFTVIGGLGGLSVLARLEQLESITFFDINPYALEVCELVTEVIRKAEDRNAFISLIYMRPFDSELYSLSTQTSFYDLPIDTKRIEKLRLSVGPRLFELFKRVYWPYIQNPMEDLYDGETVHCTRLPVFHEAPIGEGMTTLGVTRNGLRARKMSNINSFFFGKGWLRDETRYHRVRQHLINCPISLAEKSIFDLDPPACSGLYASNVHALLGRDFCPSIKEKFAWILCYNPITRSPLLENANV